MSQHEKEKNFLNVMKRVYKKPTVNVTVSGKMLKDFLLMPGARQGCPPSSTFIMFYVVILDITFCRT